jgi:hypothetical protein
MTFAGGTYDEVARWLWNFLTSHAKRVDPCLEVLLEAGDDREGRSYAARLRRGATLGPAIELDFHEVAARRGDLAWCTALADRTSTLAREHPLEAPAAAPR